MSTPLEDAFANSGPVDAPNAPQAVAPQATGGDFFTGSGPVLAPHEAAAQSNTPAASGQTDAPEVQSSPPPKALPPGLQKYWPLITAKAEKYDLPPLAFAGLLMNENSAGDPTKIGGDGEIGLGQVKPDTAASMGYDPKTLSVPERNLDAAAHFLSNMYNLTIDPKSKVGDYALAYRGYNGGPGAMKAPSFFQNPLVATGDAVLPHFGLLSQTGQYALKAYKNYVALGGNPKDLPFDNRGSFGQTLLNGLTGNNGAQVESGVDAALHGIANFVHPQTLANGEPATFGNVYREDMGDQGPNPGMVNQQFTNYAVDHPVANVVGNVAGSIAPSLAGGGLALAGMKSLPVVGDAIANATTRLAPPLMRAGELPGGFGNNLLRYGVVAPATGAAANFAATGGDPSSLAPGALISGGLGVAGKLASLGGGAIKDAIYNSGTLGPFEAGLVDKAKSLGIDLTPANIARSANATPAQEDQLAAAGLTHAANVLPVKPGAAPITDFSNKAANNATNAVMAADKQQYIKQLPIQGVGTIMSRLNGAFDHLYRGDLKDQDNTGTISRENRSMGRERILTIQKAFNHAAENQAAEGKPKDIPGLVLDSMFEHDGPIGKMVDASSGELRGVGQYLQNALKQAMQDTAKARGVDYDGLMSKYDDARANYATFMQLLRASDPNRGGKISPQALTNEYNASVSNEKQSLFGGKLDDLVAIAHNFLKESPEGTFKAPLKTDAITSGTMGAAGSLIGQAYGNPGLGAAIGAAPYGIKTAFDAALPHLRNNELYKNMLMAQARGQAANVLPGQYQLAPNANALLNAVTGGTGVLGVRTKKNGPGLSVPELLQ